MLCVAAWMMIAGGTGLATVAVLNTPAGQQAQANAQRSAVQLGVQMDHALQDLSESQNAQDVTNKAVSASDQVSSSTGPGGLDPRDSSKFIRQQRLPDSDRPSYKYQRLVTGKDYEEVWRLSSGREVHLDAINDGYVVEAKWAGKNMNAWESSPYNPANPFYNEADILDQASRQLQFAQEQGLKGIRWAISNEKAMEHYRLLFQRVFEEAYNSGFLRVISVSGSGM